MLIARPTAAEERWLTLATRYPLLRQAVERVGQGGRWKTTTWLGRCLGFLLGLLGTGMLAGVLYALPAPLLIGGLLLVVAAEWLVAQRRVFRSGIEEAVYLCGAVSIAVQLLVWTGGSNDAAAVACVATAVLLVGWRLLNPLFTTLAIAGYSLAIACVGGSLFSGRMNAGAAAVYCVLVAMLALLGSARSWRRPAHDRMLDGLVIAMPWFAHGWLLAYGGRSGTPTTGAALALALAFLAVNLGAGLRRRQHAPLVGALGNVVCAAFALHWLLPWPVHWQLVAAGALLLAAAVVVDRRLRDRVDVTSRAIEEPAGLDLAQLAAAASLSPSPGAAHAGVHGQGGGFGGGGASGRF